MDLSTSFQLSSVPSQKSSSDSRSRAEKRIAVGLGDYVIATVEAGVDRSSMTTVANLKLINEGVSFKVFRAMRLNPASGQRSLVAVKMLKDVPSDQSISNYPEKAEFRASQLDSLVREVKILCHSPLRDHENILNILEWGMGLGNELAEERDKEWEAVAPFICVELAELNSLKDYQMDQLSGETKRELCLDVVLGLASLHACNVTHGDIKLENVLVFPHPERLVSAKLSDFSHSFSPSFTSCGTSAYFGTKRCQPPEVESSRDKKRTIRELMRCDVWALGYLSVEMIADAQVPSDQGGDTLLYGLNLITRADDMNSSLKDVWRNFLQNCLKTDPEERGTVQKLRVLLDTASRSKPLVAAPIDDSRTVFGTIPCQASFLQCDSKRAIYKKFHNSCFDDALRNNLFQLGLCHLMGFGTPYDLRRGGLSIAMASSETSPTSPIAAVYDRMFASSNDMVTTRGQSWQNSLQNVPNNSYFSARVRAFQKHVIGLVESGELSNMTSQYEGVDPLLLTCLGNLEVLECHDLVNMTDHHNRTALHYACMGGHKASVQAVLHEEGGSKLKFARDQDGCTPLHWLIMFDEQDIHEVALLLVDAKNINATCGAQKLLHHCLTLKGSPLHWAVLTRNEPAICVLLESGADIELSHDWRTPLDLAVEFHLFEIVELLLKYGASFKSGSGFGRTSMHLFAGNVSVVQRRLIHGWEFKRAAAWTLQRLQKYGEDVNSRDDYANTPLHRAVGSPFERGDLYVIELLLANGASRNAQNKHKDTSLHVALRLAWCDKPNDNDIVALLIKEDFPANEEDIDPNIRDLDGCTPLLLASALHLSDIKILFSNRYGKRIDFLAKNYRGENFFDMGINSEQQLLHVYEWIKALSRKGLGMLPG